MPYNQYYDLSGAAGNYASTPNVAAYAIANDFDFIALLAMDDWTPAATTVVIAKHRGGGFNYTYGFQIETNGKLRIGVWNGSSFLSNFSSVATGITDGAKQWIRGTLDGDDGGGNRVAKFYLGGDGDTPSWVQLGTTVTTAGTSTAAAPTVNNMELGGLNAGASNILAGNIYTVELYDGIGGTRVLAFDGCDFTLGDSDTDTAVDADGRTWTLHGVGSVIAGAACDPTPTPTITTLITRSPRYGLTRLARR